MANPNANGGHIGFLPVKKLAQGYQNLGTLNMYLYVFLYQMVQKFLLGQFVLGSLTPQPDYEDGNK